jgi:integrase
MMRPRRKIRFRQDRNVWEVDYRDGEGRRRRPLFASEEAPHEHATEVLRSHGLLAVPAEDREISIRAYAARWLTLIEHEKDANTIRNYKERLEGNVLPALGHLKVRELHRGHIKVFLAEKCAKGYAKNTVRLMRATLSAMLSDAVDDGIIMANPAFGLGRRKASRADRLTPAERIQKVRPMSWERRDAFLGAVKNPRYSTLFELLAKAGLRPGEAFALQPVDIDWRTGRFGSSAPGTSSASSPPRPTRSGRWTCRRTSSARSSDTWSG